MASNEKSISISKLLVFLSVFFVLILSATGFYAYFTVTALGANIHELITKRIPSSNSMSLVDMNHDAIRGAVFHGIIAAKIGDSKRLSEAEKELDEYTENITKYYADTKSHITDEALLKVVNAANDDLVDYVKQAKSIFAFCRAFKPDQAMADFDKFQNSFEKLETSLGAMSEEIHKAAKESSEQALASSSAGKTSIAIGVFVGLLVTVVAAVLLISRMKKIMIAILNQLDSESEKIDESSSTLMESSIHLESVLRNQSQATLESTTALTEVDSMIGKTNEISGNLVSMLARASHTAQGGRDAAAKMKDSMGQINAANGDLVIQVQQNSDKMNDVLRVISEIGDKTKIINEIVFQTKLLSFNASVEAARAGEHGKGFSVVAEEIGNLATVSGNAAKDISSMLDTGIQRVNSIVEDTKRQLESSTQKSKTSISGGLADVEKCYTAIEKILEDFIQFDTLANQVSIATNEQSHGVREARRSAEIIDEGSHSISSASSQSRSLAQNMKGQAETLITLVDELKSAMLDAA